MISSLLLVPCMAVRLLFLQLLGGKMIERLLGGADTTVSAEYAFFLAMVLTPGKISML